MTLRIARFFPELPKVTDDPSAHPNRLIRRGIPDHVHLNLNVPLGCVADHLVQGLVRVVERAARTRRIGVVLPE